MKNLKTFAGFQKVQRVNNNYLLKHSATGKFLVVSQKIDGSFTVNGKAISKLQDQKLITERTAKEKFKALIK